MKGGISEIVREIDRAREMRERVKVEERDKINRKCGREGKSEKRETVRVTERETVRVTERKY